LRKKGTTILWEIFARVKRGGKLFRKRGSETDPFSRGEKKRASPRGAIQKENQGPTKERLLSARGGDTFFTEGEKKKGGGDSLGKNRPLGPKRLRSLGRGTTTNEVFLPDRGGGIGK